MKSAAKRIISYILILLVLGAGSFAYAATDRGDLNGNGVIDAGDAALIIKHVSHKITLNDTQKARADVDGDTLVTASDAALLLRLITGETSDMSACEVKFTLAVTANLGGQGWVSELFTKANVSNQLLSAASCIEELREENRNFMLLDGGASLYGSDLSLTYAAVANGKGTGLMASIFTAMGYDAVALSDTDFNYGRLPLRTDIDAMRTAGTPVLMANYLKNDPTTADPDMAVWNGASPYIIREYTNSCGEVLTVGVIALLTESLDVEGLGFGGVNGIEPLSMSEIYSYYEKTLTASCDMIIAVVAAEPQNETTGEEGEKDSVSALVRSCSSIDLVLCSKTEDISSAVNAEGRKIPVVGLPKDASTVGVMNVSFNTYSGQLQVIVSSKAVADYKPLGTLQAQILRIYNIANVVSSVPVGYISEPVSPVSGYHEQSAWMELIHQAQIWAASSWAESENADLPDIIASVAYPYMSIKREGVLEGELNVGDLCCMTDDSPSFSLIIMRGREITAWLDDYATSLAKDELPYSLYGLNYTLDTREEEGFRVLSLTSFWGLDVANDELIAVFVAEKGEAGSLFLPYIDESYMTMEDRIVESFTLPEFDGLIPDYYAGCRVFAAYLKSEGWIRPYGYNNWSMS